MKIKIKNTLIVLGVFCAIVELLEIARWVRIVSGETWNNCYIVEYVMILVGLITVVYLFWKYLAKEL